MKVNSTEAVFEYVLLLLGAVVTCLALLALGMSRGWAIALAVPGALAFPWGVALMLAMVAHWIDRR